MRAASTRAADLRPAPPRRWQALLVSVVTLALVLGVALRAVPTLASWTTDEWAHASVGTSQLRCGTDTSFRSHAQAKAIGGGLFGTDLDTLAAARGMDLLRTPTAAAVPTPSTATDLGVGDGDPATDTFGNPLAVSALSGIVGLDATGLGVGLPAGSAGALNQYTQVSTTGRAVAASGLVSNSGAVLVGRGTPPGQLPQPAVVDLTSVFSGLADVTGARLSVGAVGSSASLDFCEALRDDLWGPGAVTGITRGYGVAGLGLEVDSPSASALVSNVRSTVSAISTAVPTLVGTTGLVAQTIVGGVLTASNSIAVGLALGTPSGSVTMSSINLPGALGTLLSTALSDGTVTVDLENGRLRVNLAGLLGDAAGGLNDLPPNSALALGGTAVGTVTTRVDALVQGWSTQVTAALLGAVRAATLTVSLTIPVRTLGLLDIASVSIQASGTVGSFVDRTVQIQTSVVSTGIPLLVNAILSALLPGLTLSTYVTRLRAALPGSLEAPVADVLTAQLSGHVATLGGTLATTRGSLVTAVTGVTARLPNALSLMVNVQPDHPGAPPGTAPVPGVPPYTSPTYSVTALRIGIAAPGAPSGFVHLSMARSTVGPVTQVR